MVSRGTAALQRPNPGEWVATPGDYATLSNVHHLSDGTYPIERSFYVGVGLNLNEVLFGTGPNPNFARYKDTLPGWAARKTLEYVQVPYTSVYAKSRFSTVHRVGTTFQD